MNPGGALVLVEPWYRESHRAFIDGCTRHSSFRTIPILLDHQSWRRQMRTGAIALSDAMKTVDEIPSAILVSDYVNLTALRALSPQFNRTPWLIFFHEDQFTYPARNAARPDPEFGAINVLSALAADRCIFPTRAALDAFSEALLTLDTAPVDPVSLMHRIGERSVVCPVGCDFASIDAARDRRADKRDEPLHILFPHRHSFDKNPGEFFEVILALAAENLDFRLSVLGESYPDSPPIIAEALSTLGDRVVSTGYKTGDAYAAILGEADVVVSTAFQETQGLAVIEAIRAGCRPLLPNRLSYPEILGAEHDSPFLYENKEHLKKKLRAAILHPAQFRRFDPLWPTMSRFAWTTVAPRLDRIVGDGGL